MPTSALQKLVDALSTEKHGTIQKTWIDATREALASEPCAVEKPSFETRVAKLLKACFDLLSESKNFVNNTHIMTATGKVYDSLDFHKEKPEVCECL